MRLFNKSTLCLMLVISATSPARSQTRKGQDAAEAKSALESIFNNVKLSYYDPAYRGINIDSLHEVAKQELAKADNAQERYRAIWRFLDAFDDSHTALAFQSRVTLGDYHFGYRFFGDVPLITKVDPGTKAETAGLRPGDEIVAFNGTPLKRETASRTIAQFLLGDEVRELKLAVKGVDGSRSDLTLTVDTMEIRRMSGSKFRRMYSSAVDSLEFATSHVQVAIGDSVFVWRFPQFAYADKGIGDVIKRARKYRVLVIDLRGNPGGSIKTLTNVLGYFVDKEVPVGDFNTRTSHEKFVAKPAKSGIDGRLIVLVNSETASAAEVFARLLQLNRAALVIGDRTAGKVMASEFFPATETLGASISVSDFVLYNGERLERAGVTPDISAVETPRHVSQGGDPVLTLGLLKAGVRLAPANARHLYDSAQSN